MHGFYEEYSEVKNNEILKRGREREFIESTKERSSHPTLIESLKMWINQLNKLKPKKMF